jgi:lysyl-tRNA synthetase class 2
MVDAERLEKLKALRKAGIEPYPYSFEQDHHAEDIKNNYSELEGRAVSVAGRLVSLREHGKLTFADLQDQSGNIQLWLAEDSLGEENYSCLKYLESGDIVGAEGIVTKTKKGEISVKARKLVLLAKTLRNLPSQWYGLKDVELRYRMRYVDLIMNPEVRKTFIIRNKIISAMREFLNEKGYVEVETPILQPIYGGGFAKPFVTIHNELKMKMYLRISDEMYLKRLIVGGFEKVFEFSYDFRNESIDRTHNPEFLQVEMMTAYADYKAGMRLVEDVISYAAKKALGNTSVNFQGTELDFSRWERLTMLESIEKHCGINAERLSEKQLLAFLEDNKLEIPADKRKGNLINQIFEELVQPKLIKPTIIYDYPVEVSALARACRDNPRFTERFEMFVMGFEVGNNYTEITDPLELEKRFREELKRGEAGEEEVHPMDADFLKAMEHGMPPTAGTAIGIDRLVMLLTNSPCIRDVILFPAMRPEESEVKKETEIRPEDKEVKKKPKRS